MNDKDVLNAAIDWLVADRLPNDFSFTTCLKALFKCDDVPLIARFLSEHFAWLRHNTAVAHEHIIEAFWLLKTEPVVVPGRVLQLGGTGGAGKSRRLNTTSLATLVAASVDSGWQIVKFGNSGQRTAGSTDFWEIALGIPGSSLNVARATSTLPTTGLAIIHARTVIPLLGKLRAARQQVQGPTVLNLVGPLLHPIYGEETMAAIGVFDEKFLMPVAHAMQQLGLSGVVYSGTGEHGSWLDELSSDGMTYVIGIGRNELYRPATLLTQYFSTSETVSAAVLDRLVQGDVENPAARWVIENAAFLLAATGRPGSAPNAASVREVTITLNNAVRNGSVKRLIEAYR
ncbi:MAG: hypothetical protein WC052_03480 [Patescibacteria group bacterium]|jgi:anthranilate phosphoribosyltransferase